MPFQDIGGSKGGGGVPLKLDQLCVFFNQFFFFFRMFKK